MLLVLGLVCGFCCVVIYFLSGLIFWFILIVNMDLDINVEDFLLLGIFYSD